MSSPPRQPTVEGERLRRGLEEGRRGVTKQVQGERLVGTTILLPGAIADPGAGWHRCNGQELLRSRYPQLAVALAGSGDDATIVVTAAVAPAGFVYWMWGPEG